MNEVETFFGMIESTADALRVFELCRQGRLGRVRRRLYERERKFIRSGSVFVFDEQESGIKRWTDGRVWSPSRILGNFLVYRELERRAVTSDDPGPPRQLLPLEPLPPFSIPDKVYLGGGRHPSQSSALANSWLTRPVIDDTTIHTTNITTATACATDLSSSPGVSTSPAFTFDSCIDPNKVMDMNSFHRQRTVSLSEGCAPTASFIGPNSSRLLNSKKLQTSSAVQSGQSKYVFRPNGFIKKTISARVDGRIQHLICYFSEEDFLASHMPMPLGTVTRMQPKPFVRMMEELRKTRIPADLVLAQTFRKQPAAEPGFPVFPERTAKRRNSLTGSISSSISTMVAPPSSSGVSSSKIFTTCPSLALPMKNKIYPRGLEIDGEGGDGGNNLIDFSIPSEAFRNGDMYNNDNVDNLTDPVSLLLSETTQFIENYKLLQGRAGSNMESTKIEQASHIMSSSSSSSSNGLDRANSEFLNFDMPEAPRFINHNRHKTIESVTNGAESVALAFGSDDPPLPIIDRPESIENL